MTSNRAGRALAALVALTLLWGYTWIVMKLALGYAGPFANGALRTVAGAAALFIAMIATRRSLRLMAPGRIAVLGLFQTGGFIALSSWALVEGGAGKTAVLIFTMPIWTLLLSRFMLGERLRPAQKWAAAVALAGLTLIIAPWQLDTPPVSKLLAVLAAVSWAVATVLVKRWRTALAADVLSVTAWQMAFGGAILAAIAWLVPERPVDWAPPFVAMLTFMALVSSALGWLLWLYVLEHLPAWQASLSILGIPAVATLLSRWLLDERVAAHELWGMLLIAVGLGVMSFLNWRAQRRRAT